MSRHLIVMDPALLPDAVAKARETGLSPRPGFVLPDQPWDVTTLGVACFGEVGNADEASAPLLCAARGATVVIAVRDAALIGRLYEDLRRLGSVEQYDGPVAEPAREPALTDDQAALLRLLAAGHSVPEAAGRLFLSQRTAERRLAAARTRLGVTSTAEALQAFRNHQP
jgi:DNA-binding CsgD family transcriptional regulator